LTRGAVKPPHSANCKPFAATVAFADARQHDARAREDNPARALNPYFAFQAPASSCARGRVSLSQILIGHQMPVIPAESKVAEVAARTRMAKTIWVIFYSPVVQSGSGFPNLNEPYLGLPETKQNDLLINCSCFRPASFFFFATHPYWQLDGAIDVPPHTPQH